MTRSNSSQSAVPAWKQIQDKNVADRKAAFEAEFGEKLPDGRMPVQKKSIAKKMKDEDFVPEEEEEESDEEEEEEDDEELSSEEARSKGKAGKQAAKNPTPKRSTAVNPKTRGGTRTGAGRKKRQGEAEDDDEVPTKRRYYNFSGNETLCLFVLNYVLENRE